VWTDSFAGYFYRPDERQYGKTDLGAFACLHGAMESNYWDTSPISSMLQKAGKNIPFTPIYVGS
jgi:hypothetical protein